jgi:hypothetical protein
MGDPVRAFGNDFATATMIRWAFAERVSQICQCEMCPCIIPSRRRRAFSFRHPRSAAFCEHYLLGRESS